ncbi:Uncharacterised protein [Mycobacterium tuberculosis]|jgi:hypothetical protein|nr:Uncharacterised protein [Mycobacterium tuberculosis]
MASVNNTLIYVEKQLILPIAVKLVGSSLATRGMETGSAGFSWFLAAKLGYASESGSDMNLADLFPEDIFSFAYTEIENKNLSVQEFAEAVAARRVVAPDVITVEGTLRFPGIAPQRYDPFQPPDIDLPHEYRIYGLQCFTGVLEKDGFEIPLYFLVESAELVLYAYNKPVEVVGVVKWSPSYEVAGHALNGIVLVAALLLRR